MTTAPHDHTNKIVDAHAAVRPSALLPWRRRAIHKLVERAEAAGVADTETVDWLVSTAVLGRHVWFPVQVGALIAVGLLADDGPVEGFPDRRWYVVPEVSQ
jgi:hypothetical protein